MENAMELTAYQITPSPLRLTLADPKRAWQRSTPYHHAERCLPMLIANQSGWWVLNGTPFWVVWCGGQGANDLTFLPHGNEAIPDYVHSQFGYGVLTINLPWLFRTPEGWDLEVRGPANAPKDGISPLEGVVETDWSVATFTVNWQFTRPGVVHFAAGEPLCQLVPRRRGELEQWQPRVEPMPDDLRERYDAWRVSRAEFNAQALAGLRHDWQKDYALGRALAGDAPPDHQTRLNRCPVADGAGEAHAY